MQSFRYNEYLLYPQIQTGSQSQCATATIDVSCLQVKETQCSPYSRAPDKKTPAVRATGFGEDKTRHLTQKRQVSKYTFSLRQPERLERTLGKNERQVKRLARRKAPVSPRQLATCYPTRAFSTLHRSLHVRVYHSLFTAASHYPSPVFLALSGRLQAVCEPQTSATPNRSLQSVPGTSVATAGRLHAHANNDQG